MQVKFHQLINFFYPKIHVHTPRMNLSQYYTFILFEHLQLEFAQRTLLLNKGYCNNVFIYLFISTKIQERLKCLYISLGYKIFLLYLY